jgi:hypothetical protein
MVGYVCRSGSQWRATGGVPAGGLAPPGTVHLPRASRGGGGVRQRADVVARDVVAERAPVFQGVFNSLNQFSNAIFSKF